MKLKFRWEWDFRNTQKRLPLMCCPNCKTFGYTAYRNEVVIEGFWKTKYTGKFTKPWFECTNCMYTKR